MMCAIGTPGTIMAPSKSADVTLLALGEALDAVDVALLAGDGTVPMSDEVRAELTSKWMYVASSMVSVRARTPKGKRVKAITLQLLHERLSPESSLFVDLSLSLSHDLAVPLRRNRVGA